VRDEVVKSVPLTSTNESTAVDVDTAPLLRRVSLQMVNLGNRSEKFEYLGK
jgi:hypothetical protein